MWYNGRSAACPSLDAVMPAAGSIGTPVLLPPGVLHVHWFKDRLGVRNF